MPESESPQVKLTVTSVLFHPYAFAAGEREPIIVGGVLSISTVSVCGASLLPALSVEKNVTVLTPSAVIGSDAELPATVVAGVACAPLTEYVTCFTPEPPLLSVAIRATVTSVLFQPLLFRAG